MLQLAAGAAVAGSREAAERRGCRWPGWRSGCGGCGAAAVGVGPGFAEAEAFAEIIEAEGVGEGGAIAAGVGGVVGLDDLIADPAGDEEAEDAVFVGERDEDGEDDEVDDAFGVLAVVHGADAGDEAEQGGEAGVRFSGCRVVANAVDIGAGREAAGSRRLAPVGRCACSGESGGEAGFAEDSSADDAGTLLADWFAAVLAKRSMFTIWMVGAVHTNPPSCLKTLGLRTTKACVAKGEGRRGGTDSTSRMLPPGVSRRLEPGLGLVCFWFCFWAAWFLILIVGLLAAAGFWLAGAF